DDAIVPAQRREEREDRERVHADPLEPAEVAWHEARDLGEEEAAAGPERRDDERGPELVSPQAGAQGAERRADTGEIQQPEKGECGGDRLSGDGEDRKRDDRVVDHGRTLPRGYAGAAGVAESVRRARLKIG